MTKTALNATDAIEQGRAHAAKNGLTKPNDIAFCVLAMLDNAGYDIICKPGKKNSFDGANKSR